MAKADRSGGKKRRKKFDLRWVITIFFTTIVISGTISFTSSSLMASSGVFAAFLILLVIVLLGILFDIVGVAVTSAEEKPFHSMAAHKEPGAKEALVLLRNAGRVSSVCNDVVGDICGIVSGTTTAVIVVRLQTAFALPESVLLSVAATAWCPASPSAARPWARRWP